jgi:uridine kinase
MSAARRVIAVAGPVGAGKSTLASALAERLGDACLVRFDDYEQATRRPVDEVAQWMRTGADVDRIDIPLLGEHLAELKAGRAITAPSTGRTVEPRRNIVFETQFGRRHAASGRHIDFLIWLDTPLDIALARKLRQLVASVDRGRDGEAAGFANWLETYLGNYVEVVGALLRMQRDVVAAGADLVLDGQLMPQALAERAASAVVEQRT